jgi:hypothetical protein
MLIVAARFWECGDTLWPEQDFKRADHSFSLENGNDSFPDCNNNKIV